MWIVSAIGQLLLVDTLTIHGRTRISEVVPQADLFDTMAKNTIDFGMLGSNTAFRAFAGFSAWSALLLIFLGIAYLLLSRQDGVVLRPFTSLAVVISATFTVVAAVCYIYPAALGALYATALFAVSRVKNER